MQKAGPKTRAFFETVLKSLEASRIPFLVGGGYAMKRHTGLERAVRDLDIFVLPSDVEGVLRHFKGLGHTVDLTFPHWLGKIYNGRVYVDIIFSSGNGIATVDEVWFDHAIADFVLEQPIRLCPVEEMIWSKAFVMERDRFDGADVNHLVLARGPDMDWARLLERFGPNRLVLLSHLVLFLFVYPSEKDRVPRWVWGELLAELDRERARPASSKRICRGTVLSRSQYLDAVDRGYGDARLPPHGTMSVEDVITWTQAARDEGKIP